VEAWALFRNFCISGKARPILALAERGAVL